MERIVLVCGGRHYRDYDRVCEVLDSLIPEPTKIVTGGATGADLLAEVWAYYRHVSHEKYPADWRTHGYAAGPIRNAEMLSKEQPHIVVAFPGGAGTADMVRKAKKAGIEVLEVK